MIAMFSFVQGWLSQFHDERGDFNTGGAQSLLIVIVLCLAAVALFVYIFGGFNVGD